MKTYGLGFIHCAVACDDKTAMNHAMETIYLATCPYGVDAWALAREIGMSLEHEYRNLDGRLLRWELAGFRCNELEDLDAPVRMEVFSRFMALSTAKALLEDYEALG